MLSLLEIELDALFAIKFMFCAGTTTVVTIGQDKMSLDWKRKTRYDPSRMNWFDYLLICLIVYAIWSGIR